MQETIEPTPVDDIKREQLPPSSQEELRRQRKIMAIMVILALVIIIGLIVAVYFLIQPGTDTAKIRDIFIIFMALESIILMLVIVVLIFQMSILINLLKNEITPILETTNETVSTLRGTTKFVSDNLAEPIIKLNEYLAGLQQLFHLTGMFKPGRSKKSKNSEGE